MSPYEPTAHWPNFHSSSMDDSPGFFPTSPHGDDIVDVNHAVFDDYTITKGAEYQPVQRGDADSKTPQGLGNIAPLGQREWGAK